MPAMPPEYVIALNLLNQTRLREQALTRKVWALETAARSVRLAQDDEQMAKAAAALQSVLNKLAS